MRKLIQETVADIDSRNPGVENAISMALNQGKIPLLVGISGTGKSVLATRALGLPYESGYKIIELYWEKNGQKLSRSDYFQPTEKGTLLIDEIHCYQQGDELEHVLALAISHDMKVVITSQNIGDVDPQILKNKRIVQINLH
ncbi:ATP-binding protein (plasmid) [Shewanella sp. LC6]|uniref:ATP-binding protein n=1 Tax=unclassified Shewanella TaxID=196818 RepID=UPI00112B52DD|nr:MULTISPECIES: ATP-binding protein [unclassified Shewanella]QQK62587.1 ATP-binding protein [Shewanella sp. LC6]TPE64081.1 ATP-binding protein [Shewanella sp. LC2]